MEPCQQIKSNLCEIVQKKKHQKTNTRRLINSCFVRVCRFKWIQNVSSLFVLDILVSVFGWGDELILVLKLEFFREYELRLLKLFL